MFAQQLQGNVAIELRIPGPVNLTERTAADPLSDPEVRPFGRGALGAPERGTIADRRGPWRTRSIGIPVQIGDVGDGPKIRNE